MHGLSSVQQINEIERIDLSFTIPYVECGMIRYLTLLLSLLLATTGTLRAQYTEEERNYWQRPVATRAGVVVTDNLASALCLISGDSVRVLISAPGCGNNFTVTPDGGGVGFKLIDASGRQVPAILTLKDDSVEQLEKPYARVGQPSFADDGTTAYTLGENLIVHRGSAIATITLGFYANWAPISPDGRYVAFNTADDQIWVLNLQDGNRTKVSDHSIGYFHPLWSPDGTRLLFSSLSGEGYVYDFSGRMVYALGEARSPTWMPDSRTILFHRLDIDGTTLKNSDIFAASWDGSLIRSITTTADVFEMDPSYDPLSGAIIYHTFGRQEVCSRRVSFDAVGMPQLLSLEARVLIAQPPVIRREVTTSLRKATVPTTLDIPYVHQCYDTPDWHNGNGSCAPTAGMMVLAYYGILPPWPTYCSTPYVHWNDWGGYVADKYQFRDINYADYQTTDYGGHTTWGAYGYMWKIGSPHSRMEGFYRNNGVATSQTESTPHNVALTEVQAGRPFTMCVMLTSAGHVVIAHGVGAEEHTFVFNDPYGNKNQGYKNYYGKNVQYDWPGYNNGFQNLTEVAWCIATSFSPFPPADTLVDDLQFEKGFHLNTSAPASMTLWKDTTAGIGGHSWHTATTATDACYAIWTPSLPQAGPYEIFAYVPPGSTASGRYVVTHTDGIDTVSINQTATAGAWVSLGTYDFTSAASVRLGSGSATTGSRLGFDALRWSYRGVTSVDRISKPSQFALEQNFPNPFNPSTRIRYEVAELADVTLVIFDVLGRRVDVLVNQSHQPGRYTSVWNAGTNAAGVYLASLTARTSSGFTTRTVQKMILVR